MTVILTILRIASACYLGGWLLALSDPPTTPSRRQMVIRLWRAGSIRRAVK